MLDNVTDQPLTAEENEKLIAQLRATKETLVTGNIPLVKYKIGAWLAEYPNLKFMEDDLLGEGILALVRAIDSLENVSEPYESNITGYISVTIQRALGTFVGNEYKHKPGGRRVADQQQFESDPTTFIDFVDALFGACETNAHRTILQMRREGYTDQEIADVLDCSRSTVRFMKAEILANFQRGEVE